MPAALTGVAGYKPPYGRVPQAPPYNLDSYCHEGPLARTVADCALMQNVIAGPHPSDLVSLRPKLIIPPELEGIRGWRIAWSPDLGFMELDEDVRRLTTEALQAFRDAGAVVEEVDIGWGRRRCEKTAMIHLAAVMGSQCRRDFGKPEQRAQLTNYMNHFLDITGEVSGANLLAGLEYTNRMYERLGPLFEDYRVLVTPTVATTRIAADFDYSRDAVVINGRKVNPFLGWVLTYPFNTLSRCPVLSVPAGLADNGVPAGIQIVGRPYDDISVFRAGIAYEQARGGPFIRNGNKPLL